MEFVLISQCVVQRFELAVYFYDIVCASRIKVWFSSVNTNHLHMRVSVVFPNGMFLLRMFDLTSSLTLWQVVCVYARLYAALNSFTMSKYVPMVLDIGMPLSKKMCVRRLSLLVALIGMAHPFRAEEHAYGETHLGALVVVCVVIALVRDAVDAFQAVRVPLFATIISLGCTRSTYCSAQK